VTDLLASLSARLAKAKRVKASVLWIKRSEAERLVALLLSLRKAQP
jgi:hypothetical protein